MTAFNLYGLVSVLSILSSSVRASYSPLSPSAVLCPTITRTTTNPYCPYPTREVCAQPAKRCILEKIIEIPCGCPTTVPTSTQYIPCTVGCYAACGTFYDYEQLPCPTTSVPLTAVTKIPTTSLKPAPTSIPICNCGPGPIIDPISVEDTKASDVVARDADLVFPGPCFCPLMPVLPPTLPVHTPATPSLPSYTTPLTLHSSSSAISPPQYATLTPSHSTLSSLPYATPSSSSHVTTSSTSSHSSSTPITPPYTAPSSLSSSLPLYATPSTSKTTTSVPLPYPTSSSSSHSSSSSSSSSSSRPSPPPYSSPSSSSPPYATPSTLKTTTSPTTYPTPIPTTTPPIYPSPTTTIPTTCFTITETTGSSCPELYCAHADCDVLKTATLSCGCGGSIPTVTSCATKCAGGCYTAYTQLGPFPCPFSFSHVVIPESLETTVLPSTGPVKTPVY